MKTSSLAVAVTLALTVSGAAQAQQTVYRGTTGIERIHKGVFELGLDNVLLIQSASSAPGSGVTTSHLSAAYTGGLTPRYFVADNFSVALNLNLFYTHVSDGVTQSGQATTVGSTDLGFLGFAMANYYLRLGFGMFFKPGLGVGFFTGKRELPNPLTGVSQQSSLSGVAGRLDLGFVYYASSHFNLKAGLDVVARTGSETPVGATSGHGFGSTDAGFNVGLGYSF